MINDRHHPGPLPREREKLFPRLGDWVTVSGRRFRGSMRELFRGNLIPAFSPKEKEKWFPRLSDWVAIGR